MDLPTGYSPPAYSNTPDDHGGWVVIASSVGLVFILTLASIRFYTRNPFRSRLLWEDAAIIVAVVSAITKSGLVIAAVSQGLGKAETIVEHNLQGSTERMLYAGDLLYLTATSSARTAVSFLVHTLSPEYWHTLATKYCIALSMLMSVTGVFMVAFGCDIEAPWSQIVNECESIYKRWIAITAFGIALELAIFAITFRMLFNVQRRWTGKFKATMVFALRLPIILISVYRLLSLRDVRSSSDPFFNRVLPIAWTQGEQAYGFATAVIPSLMPFLMKLNTGLGALSREDFVMETTRHESSGNFALQSLKPSQRGSMMRADNVTFQSSVVAKKDQRRSMSSDDSKRIMVKRTVDISYPEEHAGTSPR